MALDLPVPGGDAGVWDDKLNAALTQLDNEKASQASVTSALAAKLDTAVAASTYLTTATASATYASAFPDLVITYNPDQTPATVTEDGITTTYTYNPDGTVATATRNGETKTYAYTGGNLTAVA